MAMNTGPMKQIMLVIGVQMIQVTQRLRIAVIVTERLMQPTENKYQGMGFEMLRITLSKCFSDTDDNNINVVT